MDLSGEHVTFILRYVAQLAVFFYGLLFNHIDEGNMFLRNVR
jgi:hypothetical protein